MEFDHVRGEIIPSIGINCCLYIALSEGIVFCGGMLYSLSNWYSTVER
jgi:hypothetical protein